MFDIFDLCQTYVIYSTAGIAIPDTGAILESGRADNGLEGAARNFIYTSAGNDAGMPVMQLRGLHNKIARPDLGKEGVMTTLRKPGGRVCPAVAAAVLVCMAGVMPPVAALESGPYSGSATLCAMDMTGVTVESKGNAGTTYTYNQLFLFRIDTDNDLMHGWEVLTANTKATQGGGGYNWGEALLTPDGYAGTGTLVDNFKFPLQRADSVRGMYEGTGMLEGVTVDYALTPADPGTLPASACDNMPWTGCIPSDPTTCEPVPSGAAGYWMSGWVNPAD